MRDEGTEILEAIEQAARAKTTSHFDDLIATVFGAIPLADCRAGVALHVSPSAYCIVFVTIATLITLVLIPLYILTPARWATPSLRKRYHAV
jgi:multidrug efflux pump